MPKKKDDGTVEIELVPQARPMTVQDLLRHTSGLTYGAIGANPVKQSYLDMKVNDRGQTNAEMADKLAKLGAALPAGHDLGIFDVDRRAGPRRRGRLGYAARQVHRGSHHQAAQDGRHRLRGRRRQEGARRQADEGGAEERGAVDPRRRRKVHLEVGRRRHGLDCSRLRALPADVRQRRPARRRAPRLAQDAST